MSPLNSEITIKLPGQKIESAPLPRALQARTRGLAAEEEDRFLLRDLVQVEEAYDVSLISRSIDGRVEETQVKTQSGQVIALELADGVTVFTSPDNLKQTLERVAPGAIDSDGAVHVDGFRDRGVATRGVIGDAVTNVVSRVFMLNVGSDAIIDIAKRKALEWMGGKAEEKLQEYAGIGVGWLGTKALMWAIESRLDRKPGLYRWEGATRSASARGAQARQGAASGEARSFQKSEPSDLLDDGDRRLEDDARQGPLLLFIHGTASSTLGSFGDLQDAPPEYWLPIENRFGQRIYAFEHYTLSESPIENALQLARALPAGAQLNLVTHSSGGLIGDLLCLENLDAPDSSLIAQYAIDQVAIGEADPAERERIETELIRVYSEQRARLQELAIVLAQKKIRIQRYVRAGAPARGTRLISGNFDVFLSGLLTLIGLVPALSGSPLYWAFKRVVLEVARNRAKPNLIPGIEAMLPESPMSALLARASSQPGVRLAVIAGDIEGGGLLKRLGVLFTDFMLFDGLNNDLVVDTDSMYAGIARPGHTRVLFDQGPEVNHFRYFSNESSRQALRQWLLESNLDRIEAFKPLPAFAGERSAESEQAMRRARSRGIDPAILPVVIVLPGIMGSHLWLNRTNRVWFDFKDLLLGGFAKLRWPGEKIEAEKLFGHFYADLCDYLAATHQVETFPYDWRQPLNKLGDQLEARLRSLLAGTSHPVRPIRIVAHSMGGLVVRALIHSHPKLWEQFMTREGSRFIMLGTPNQGSHSMVETLLGKSSTVRMLGRVDLKNSLQAVLDIVAEFRGALQLLPRPGFSDVGPHQKDDYFDSGVWRTLKEEMRDFWFGDRVAALPAGPVLNDARWLWDKDASTAEPLPGKFKDRVVYVFGSASNTPCGIVKRDGRWKMLGTPKGDGSVTWVSGGIPGIGSSYFMSAEHGALADTEKYFPALAELLAIGATTLLPKSPPITRAAEMAEPIEYDAGPPVFPTEMDLGGGLLGKRSHVRLTRQAPPALDVSVKAMDLLFITKPILVGHYEQDAISGAESLIDRELLQRQLTVRHNLGLYAGPIGTATVVLLARNEHERQRGSFRGAVIAGMGKYDGSLSAAALTEAVRTAAMRYLLHVVDGTNATEREEAPEGVPLASLLLGYNSSANLSITDSVRALVRGVVEANRRFGEATGSPLRILSLELVELYLDTAISATHALQTVARELNEDPATGYRVNARAELECGEGVRQRLDDTRTASYWKRLLITDADRPDDEQSRRQESPEMDRTSADSTVKPPAGGLQPTALATRLKFLHLGPRARAEVILQQRQPGLVEKLVSQQIRVKNYQEDFSRTLFQLLLPHEFKDAARQMDQVVLVLDGYTANLPWELMLAEDRPLAVKTAIVRQLTSTRFRPRIRQALGQRAYVVGNPSTEGFAAAFPNPKVKDQRDPDNLPSAENEANAVVKVLEEEGFSVEISIGQDQRALDVINRLFKYPYRILHIAAHGIFNERARDGSYRSGVVLSDGLLITAAEIGAMELVPELVFLNCCHLGQTDALPTEFNRLAYSVARELIEIGVRAVVVAGWAVDDEAASFFATTFYTSLFEDDMPFGEAVFEARQATWERFPTTITWGAYQAYGDPGWVNNPRLAEERTFDRTAWKTVEAQEVIDSLDEPEEEDKPARSPVAPQELIARLDQIRLSMYRIGSELSRTEQGRIARLAKKAVQNAPADWESRADVHAALGQLYGDLGPPFFEHAHRHYEKAIQAGSSEVVAIRAIEQLANLEARHGEYRNDVALIERAILRLKHLVQSAEQMPGRRIDPRQVNSERASLLGSAYKRKAVVHARIASMPDVDTQHLELMRKALNEAANFYCGAAGDIEGMDIRPYAALNWLSLVGLNGGGADASHIETVRRCAIKANERFAKSAGFFDAIMTADAFLVERLLDRSLEKEDGAQAALDEIERRFRAVLRGVVVRPKDLDSVIQQICLIGDLYAARAAATQDQGCARIGDTLRELARRLKPGACTAEDTTDADLEAAEPSSADRETDIVED